MNATADNFIGTFENATDVIDCVGPNAFCFTQGPISLSRFSVGSHESTARSDEVHSLYYPINSRGVLELDLAGEKARLQTEKSPVTFSPKGAAQTYAFEGETDNIMLSINADYVTALGKDWASNPGALLDPTPHLRSARIAHLIFEMYRAVRTGDAGFRIVTEALTMQLCVELFKQFAAEPPKSKAKEQGEFSIERIEEYVSANLDTNITLQELATVVGMDVFAFSRAFKAATGTTPGRFVLRSKLERVCYLLAKTDMALVEIAFACGFSSQSHLTTTFSKQIGVTPVRYRHEVTQ